MNTCIRILLLILALLASPELGRAQFDFVTNGSTITITGYNPAAGRNMIIPASTNGYPVTAIANFAFQFDDLMTNAVIPNSITSIGSYAFYGCRFLPSISLPASVTNLGFVVFNYCVRMTNITVDSANPALSSSGGVLFDKAKTTLIEYPYGLGGNYTVPGTVTNISFGAFNSSGISSVSIPASVLFIETHAFNTCLNLTNISVAPANPAYTSPGGVLYDKAQTNLMQYPCALGTNYDVPSGVIIIGPDAFAYSGLSRITLPSTMNYITYEMCYSCTNLASIVIPAAVTNVGTSAFGYCTNLSSAYFAGNAPPSDGQPGSFSDVFAGTPARVYYLPGTTDWTGSYGQAPTVLWNPQANSMNFSAGHFGFNLTGPTNVTIVIDACTNLAQAVWSPVSTNQFSTNGTSLFSDSQSGNFPVRFYRMRSP
jgi:Leucine Rich Repeat (LRR) protein